MSAARWRITPLMPANAIAPNVIHTAAWSGGESRVMALSRDRPAAANMRCGLGNLPGLGAY